MTPVHNLCAMHLCTLFLSVSVELPSQDGRLCVELACSTRTALNHPSGRAEISINAGLDDTKQKKLLNVIQACSLCSCSLCSSSLHPGWLHDSVSPRTVKSRRLIPAQTNVRMLHPDAVTSFQAPEVCRTVRGTQGGCEAGVNYSTEGFSTSCAL